MRRSLVLGMLATLGSIPGVAPAQPVVAPEKAEIRERPDHVSFGVITVDAPPAEVYAVITHYAAWESVFSDVVWLRVVRGGRDDAVVKLRTKSLGNEATVQFENLPDQELRFRLIGGPPGARARGAYRLVPIDDGQRTRIEATLYMDVVGVPGVFISDRKIRSMRQGKLRADLEDAATWFAHRRTSEKR